MIVPKRTTLIPALNASGIVVNTQVVIPEIPAAGYPITLYIGGSVVGLSDVTIDGLSVAVEGDFTHLQWELQYYVGKEIKPIRVSLAPIVEDGDTRYLLTEQPHPDFQVSLFLGGSVVGLLDYSIDGMNILIAGDWSHLQAEAEYYSNSSDDAQAMQDYLDGLQAGYTEPLEVNDNGDIEPGGGMPLIDIDAVIGASGLGQLSDAPTVPDINGDLHIDTQIGLLDPYINMLEAGGVS